MSTIFYSWQSDTSEKQNRWLIRDALKDAAALLATELELEEAPRVDYDTQDVPGTPHIVETILAKIAASSVFVADVTFVASRQNDDGDTKFLPNSNVMIEYGYAVGKLSLGRVISVINEEYGAALKRLPFNLDHLRHPIRYKLAPSASKADIKAKQNELVPKLAEAIRLILKNGEPREELAQFASHEPVWKSSSFLQDDDVVCPSVVGGFRPRGRALWKNGPLGFLRLIPTKPPGRTWEPHELRQLFEHSGNSLQPLDDPGGWSFGRNRFGAATFGGPSLLTDEYLQGLSHVLRNGEIWGLDRDLLAHIDEHGRKIIPSYALEQRFRQALHSYRAFASHALGLTLPMRVVAGLSGVEDYYLALPPGYFSRVAGPAVDDEIIHEFVINNTPESNQELLRSFFQKVWASCGVTYPEEQLTS